jgi:2'-phosphotransferase
VTRTSKETKELSKYSFASLAKQLPKKIGLLDRIRSITNPSQRPAFMSRRDRRDGGGRGISREVQVSKKLSWLLRHGAEKEGLKLGPGGYINVEQVVSLASNSDIRRDIVNNKVTDASKLNSRSIKPLKVTMDELRNIVSENDKQRFSIIPTTEAPSNSESSSISITINYNDPSHFLIRANQGHSIKVDSSDLLTPITAENAPQAIVHGTTRRAWPLILSSGGLKPMGRNHVHFATGLPAGFKRLDVTGGEDAAKQEEQAPVISGMRNSSSVLVYVDFKKAIGIGLEFWMSANGVVLCDGGEKKIVPIECFETVEERGFQESGLLVKDGVVMGELSGKGKRKD